MNLRTWVPFALLGVALAQNPNQPQAGSPNPRGPAQQPRQANRAPQPGHAANPVPGHSSGALKMYLNLNDDQLQKLMQARDQAGRQAEEKRRALEPQLRDKHRALDQLLSQGSTDPAAVGKAVLEVRNIEKQIGEAHEAARTSYLSVLTAEQRTRFKAVEDAALLPAAAREAMQLGLVPAFHAQQNPQGPQPQRGQANPGPNPGQHQPDRR